MYTELESSGSKDITVPKEVSYLTLSNVFMSVQCQIFVLERLLKYGHKKKVHIFPISHVGSGGGYICDALQYFTSKEIVSIPLAQ